MLEWQDNWNSFNSWKALMYYPQYKAIQEGKFLPPVEASVDPVNDCQLNCYYCNGTDVRHRKVKMTPEHLDDLLVFFKAWGVSGVCFAGGGEPTMHEYLGKAFRRLHLLGLQSAIITNGLFLDEYQMNAIACNARWIGVSVDCASRGTFEKMKGFDRFDEVIDNIKRVVSLKPNEVTFKFLINKDNQYEIYPAIKLAAALGCHGIHIRPVSYRNFQEKEENYDLAYINEHIERGFRDFGSKLKIFAVRHKFDDKMHVKFPFKRCKATPLMPIFQADGYITACIDRKADNSLRLCRHDGKDFTQDILQFWGSFEHKKILDKINIKDCPKCTLCHANEQYEKAVVEDRMNYAFV